MTEYKKALVELKNIKIPLIPNTPIIIKPYRVSNVPHANIKVDAYRKSIIDYDLNDYLGIPDKFTNKKLSSVDISKHTNYLNKLYGLEDVKPKYSIPNEYYQFNMEGKTDADMRLSEYQTELDIGNEFNTLQREDEGLGKIDEIKASDDDYATNLQLVLSESKKIKNNFNDLTTPIEKTLEKNLTKNKIKNIDLNRKIAGPIVYNAFDNDFKKNTKKLENSINKISDKEENIKHLKKLKNDFYKPNANKKNIKDDIEEANTHFHLNDNATKLQKIVRGRNVRKNKKINFDDIYDEIPLPTEENPIKTIPKKVGVKLRKPITEEQKAKYALKSKEKRLLNKLEKSEFIQVKEGELKQRLTDLDEPKLKKMKSPLKIGIKK